MIKFFLPLAVAQDTLASRDTAYEMGYVVGALLPFVFLVAVSYALYWYFRRSRKS
ncbi:MAG: hypothetical protein ACK5V5_09280 [Cyclobacteriaceae bacterium]|jgi:hypothetical protein|nr:hypothetical protein [Flammeovirgaceae bacterium]